MTTERIIFLDVDGVLNAHAMDPVSQSNTIDRSAVVHLNRLIQESGAAIVLCSAWRYMITGGAMTRDGFQYLLRTHGLTAAARILCHTLPDEFCEHCSRHSAPPLKWNERKEPICGWCGQATTRAMQVQRWLARAGEARVYPRRYVVIDDLDLGYTAAGLPLVQTVGKTGLTAGDVDAALAILMKE